MLRFIFWLSRFVQVTISRKDSSTKLTISHAPWLGSIVDRWQGRMNSFLNGHLPLINLVTAIKTYGIIVGKGSCHADIALHCSERRATLEVLRL